MKSEYYFFFVYGTLKGAAVMEKLKPARVMDKSWLFHKNYILCKDRGFPSLVVTDEEQPLHVKGVLYAYRPRDDCAEEDMKKYKEMVKHLDSYEGHPTFFRRVKLPVFAVSDILDTPVYAWTYLGPSEDQIKYMDGRKMRTGYEWTRGDR